MLPALLLASLGLATCGAPPPSQSAGPASASSSPIAPPSPPLSASAEATPGASTAPSVIGSAAPSESQNSITFAPPVLIKVGGHNLPAVLVTNNSDQVRSFTVSASWKAGAAEAGTAMGGVTGLEPHETRAVNLASQNAIPDGTTGAEAHVGRDFPTPSTMPAVARVVLFGIPAVHPSSFSTLDVPATNLDLQPHGFTAGAALLSHGGLIATASGQVPNIGPKLTLPVSMPIAGPDSGYDQILVYVDGVTS